MTGAETHSAEALRAASTLPNRILEILRFAGVIAGFALASSIGDPGERLRLLQLFVVVSVAGLTALESLAFASGTARVSGYGDPGPYQRQSGLNNLACALVSIFVYAAHWGSEANAAVLMTTLAFLALSGVNHALSGFGRPGRTWRSVSRPLMSLALVAACVPFLIAAL